MRKALATVVGLGCIVGAAGPSPAATIASPAVYGSYEQDGAICTVRNHGTGAVAVEVNFFDEAGNVVGPKASDSCDDGLVQPGRACSASLAGIANGVAYACSATVPGGARKLRGTLILLDAGVPVRWAELR